MTTALFKFLLFLTIIIAPLAYQSTVQNTSADTTDLQTYKQDSPPFTPSPDPDKLVFYRRGGFMPYSTSNSILINDDFSLNLTSVRPIVWWTLHHITLTYSWWTSDDQTNWQLIPNNNTGNLKIDSSKKGTKYYQAKATYTIDNKIIFNPYYSKIIKVTINEKPIDTEDLSINTSAPYLLNINSSLLDNIIYATGFRNPEKATDPIVWSTSDDNLAHVNSKGEITPVSDKNSGDVLIQALVKNSINKESKVAQKEIRVGGGLDDINAKLGEDVTFKVQGLSTDNRDSSNDISIIWFKKIPGVKGWKKINNADKMSLTIKNIDSHLDGTLYHATFSLKDKSFTTNDAQLTISDSNVGINNHIENTSHSNIPLDTPSNLTNIIENDKLNYKLHLSNANKTSLKEETLVVPLPPQVDVKKLTIDGQNVEPHYQTENFQKKNLSINLNQFKNKNELDCNINLQVNTISHNASFKSTPSIYGKNIDSTSYHNNGKSVEFHFITNILKHTVHDISFNSVHPFNLESLIYRSSETNAPNNIIDFTDDRRNFSPVKIMVEQEYNFYDLFSDTYLPATLQMYDATNNTSQDILHNPVLVATSADNQKLHYLNWNKNEGLLLKLKPGPISAGTYRTQLNWTLIEST